jgi:hypothetical protein
MAQAATFSWRRTFAWTVTLSLHAGVLLLLLRPAEHENPKPVLVPHDGLVPVTYADAPAASVPLQRPNSPEYPAPLPPALPAAQQSASRSAPDRSEALEGIAAESTSPAVANKDSLASSAPVARPNHYIKDDARALLPYEDMYAAAPPKPTAGYYTPGNGTEDDVFYRPLALEPNASAFAHAWKPGSSLLTDWLERAVNATTGTVSIPLNSKFKLVCKASVLGAAGACGIVRNGGTGVIVQRPPPAPWERSHRVQCRELREKLENANDPAVVASVLDSLAHLCVDPQNGEARREAGLP